MIQFVFNFVKIGFSLFPIVIIGIYGYRQLSKFYKFCLLQAVICVIFYAVIAANFHSHNHALLNFYLALEYAVLMAAAGALLTKRKERMWIFLGFLMFVTAFIADIIVQGIGQLANHSVAVGAVPILVIFLTLLYRSSQDKGNRSVVWLCLGLVLYFCGAAPFLTLLSFIQAHYTALSSTFLTYILEPLGHIRYLLAALSFWLFLRNQRRSNLDNTLWPKGTS